MTIIETERSGGFFSWFRGKERSTPTQTRARRPAPRDLTGGLVANDEMLRGAFHGTWQGLQFASPLMFTPISVPVYLMGLPTPHSDDERTQEVLDEITLAMAQEIKKLHRAYLLSGTTWRFPRFDSKIGALVWEPVQDSSISDLLLDVVSGAPTALIQDEEMRLSTGENATTTARRKRTFTPSDVLVSWSGSVPMGLLDSTSRNIAGILPVPFAHDTDEGEIRGHSVFSRIIRDLKDYHDIDYRVSEILTKFVPKQVQTVDDVREWCKNNLGTEDLDELVEYDVSGSDLIINRKDHESTDYKHLPGDATAAHEKAIERKYWKIFEGSGIPEMFWGGLASGNHATSDNQMQMAISYVQGLREEVTKSHHAVYAASLRLLSIARLENYREFEIRWNDLESVSAEVKAKIFQSFASAVTQMAGSASLTKKQLWTLWTLSYPKSDPGTFEEFEQGMSEMALFQQFRTLDYASGLSDFNGQGNPEDKPDPLSDPAAVDEGATK